MLFIGAGCSKAVGSKDLLGLTLKAKDELKKNGYGDVLTQIEARLESVNKNHQFFNEREIDLEVILSILNASTDYKGALKEMGPFTIYLSAFADITKLSVQQIGAEDLTRMRNMIGKVITTNVKTYSKDKAVRYYRDLFQIPIDLDNKYKTFTDTTNSPPLFAHTVTTNYDRVIENFYEDVYGKPPRIGFIVDEKTQERYLDTEGIISGKYRASNTSIEYLKLHGSIDWWIRSSDKRIVQREHSKSLRGEKYPGQLMLFPVYEKHISEDPYFALYYYFRHLLNINNAYLVIGYSFRDPSINNAFRDALTNKPASRIIIVNNNRKAIENRVNEIFPQNKVEFVEDQFGSSNLPSVLKSYLK